MKKIFTIIAALALLASAGFAQSNARRLTEKDMANISPVSIFKSNVNKVVAPVTTPTPTPKNITSFPWTEDFETGTAPAGFTFIDADNDGFNWDPAYLFNEGAGHNGSNGMIASASYDNNSASALTPDNWMILPAFEIPASGTDFTLRWFEKGQDPNYCDEVYSVYISTTGSTVSDFTTAVLTSTATGDWVKKTVSLASYAGQTIYIAFRHHNVTDMFFLDIDDIRIGGPEPPELSISGPVTVRMNEAATFTAATDVTSLTWYVDGSTETETGLSLTYTFTTDGQHTVVAEATNSAGSAFDTIDLNVVDCSEIIDDFPYVENFESEVPCWIMISNDPTNDDEFGVTSEEAFQGLSSFGFSSYSSADDYNQYLITPEIDLPTTGDYMVSFWYNAYASGDAFRVMGSTTTNDTTAFTTLLDVPTVGVTGEWVEARILLPQGTKYICINYYGDWAYYLWIDSLVITTLSEPDLTVSGTTSVGTGNPAYFHAASTLANTFSWTVDGVAQSETGADLTYTFTTAGTHTVEVSATNSVGTATDDMTVEVFNCDGITLPYTPDFSEGLHCWVSRSDADQGMGWFPSIDMFESNPVGQVLSMSGDIVWGMFYMQADVDNWLISPNVTMPAEGSFDLTWKVMTYSADYPTDHYAAYIIAEDGTETMIYEETLGPQNTNFAQRVAPIPANINGNFKVAFRHWNSENGYVIILDDIQIVAGGTVTGIENASDINVAVYPNPASQMLNVKAEGLQKVEMMDLAGRTVLTTAASHINLNGIASGIYMVRVTTANGIHTEKMVVK